MSQTRPPRAQAEYGVDTEGDGGCLKLAGGFRERSSVDDVMARVTEFGVTDDDGGGGGREGGNGRAGGVRGGCGGGNATDGDEGGHFTLEHAEGELVAPFSSSSPTPTHPANGEGASGQEQQATVKYHFHPEKHQQQLAEKRRLRQQLSRGISHLDFNGMRSKLNLNLDHPVILMAIDIEAYEFDQLALTELGISIFNTTHISHHGTTTTQVRDKITAQHFIVRENMHLVNGVHVRGCPDAFSFGESLTISGFAIAHVLATVFRECTGAAFGEDGAEARPIRPVLVGHHVESDVGYLRRSVGLDVIPLVGDVLDTDDLGKMVRRHAGNSRGLGGMLRDYGIDAVDLHNAGNDAYYTMLLLLVLLERESREPVKAEEWMRRMEREIAWEKALAEERVRRRYEGWSDEEGDREDKAGLKGAVGRLRRPPRSRGRGRGGGRRMRS